MGVQKNDRSKSIGRIMLLLVVVLLVVSMASMYLMLTTTSNAPTTSVKEGSGEVRLTLFNPYINSSNATDGNKG